MIKSKKVLAILTLVCFIFTMMPAAVWAEDVTTQCRPDQHLFGSVDNNGDCTCDNCNLKAKLVTTASVLTSAITSATDGDVLLLEEGTYNVSASGANVPIEISGKRITIIGKGMDATEIVQESGGSLIRVGKNSSTPEHNDLTLANLTLQGNNNREGVYVKYYSTVNLYNVNIKNNTIDILLDNGNNPFYEDLQYPTTVNAYNVFVEKKVLLNTVPFSHSDKKYLTHMTYAVFNYEAGNIAEKGVGPQNGIGGDNLYVNGKVLNPAIASVTTPDNRTLNFEKLAGAIKCVNETDQNGDYTVTLLKDCNESVTIFQRENINITVNANEGVTFTGKFTVNGNSRSTGVETVTFDKIHFDGSACTDNHYFIEQNDGSEQTKRYPHNITIKNCEFIDDEHFVTAIRFRQGYNIKVENCKQDGGFQFMWVTGGNENNSITGCDVRNVNEGVNLGSGSSYTISNTKIISDTFAIRVGANNEALGKSTTVSNCTIEAKQPFVIRGNAPSGDYTLSVSNSKLNDTLKNANTDTTSTCYNSAGYYSNFIERDAENFARVGVNNWDGIQIVLNNNQYLCAVTFDSMEGSSVEDVPLYTNERVPRPNNPEKIGYIFAGWYTDDSYATLYDFDTLVTGDITLYAKWDINQYTVKFDVDGTISTTSAAYGYSINAPANPEKMGHTFAGWYTDDSYVTPYDFDTPVTGDITLYAKWNKNNYTVKFDVDGDVSESNVVYGELVNAPETAEKVCQEFVGWYIGDTKADFPYEVTTDVIFKAKWNESHVDSDGKYTADATHHWKTCDCGNVIDKAKHVYDSSADALCNICSYERTISSPTHSSSGTVYVKPEKYETEVVLQIDSTNVYVDGQLVNNDAAPILVGDRTLVPIRIIIEQLGGIVEWDNETRTVTLTLNDEVMKMTIDQIIPDFDAAPIIIENRTYVPIRYIMERVGAEVDWIDVEGVRRIVIKK